MNTVKLFLSILIMSNSGITNGNGIDDPSLMENDEEEVQILDPPETLSPAQRTLWGLLSEGGPPAEDSTAQLGVEAIPALDAALKSDSEDYHYNAVICTTFLPEPNRTEQLVRLLAHDSLDVQSEAMRALNQTYDPSARESMLSVLGSGREHAVRGKIALLLAKDRDPSLAEYIHRSRLKETDTEALHDFDLALARLGDLEARSRIAENLNNPIPKQRVEAIRDYLYIDNVSSLQDLRTLLHSTEPLMNSRPAHSNIEVWLRSCDIAAEVVIKVAKLPIASKINNFGRNPLTKEQLDTVRAYVDQNRR